MVRKLVTLVLAIVVIVSMLVLGCAKPAPSAPEKPIKLLFASWSSPMDPVAQVMEQFGNELEEATGGKVIMDYSHGAALGKPPEYYDLAVKGVADIVFTLPAYSAGRFPLVELVMHPVKYPDAVTATKAYREMWERGYFDEEFSEVKVLWLACPAPAVCLFAEERIATVADFKGKKIRCSSGPSEREVIALDAVPVRMGLSSVYQAMQLGTIDGVFLPWSGAKVFKIHEVSKYVLNTGYGDRKSVV